MIKQKPWPWRLGRSELAVSDLWDYRITGEPMSGVGKAVVRVEGENPPCRVLEVPTVCLEG